MAKTYRDIAIEEMLGTVQEAMSQVIDWWGDLPPEMNEAIEQFRIELGAAIDSVEFVKKALSRQVHETDHWRGPPLCALRCMSLLLALSRHLTLHCTCPLSGVQQT
jgi:hypothetical protein